MKNPRLILILISFAFFNSYSQEVLPINPNNSEIKWIGEYTFYFGGHDGTINFREGFFIKQNEVITGGEFIIDMTSIKNRDIENPDGKENLVDHLKDDDFFDVAKYPISKLEIKSVEYEDNTHLKVFADLTIKGITKPISFQAEVDYNKKQMFTKFKIDRMLWGVNYNSTLRDGAISDAIGFEVVLSL